MWEEHEGYKRERDLVTYFRLIALFGEMFSDSKHGIDAFLFHPDFTTFTGCNVSLIQETSPFQGLTFLLDSKTVPKIPPKKWILFRALLCTPQWHLQLADDSILDPPLTFGNHEWTHYVQAGHFPDHSVYYLEFTKEEPPISKSAEVAKITVQNPGVVFLVFFFLIVLELVFFFFRKREIRKILFFCRNIFRRGSEDSSHKFPSHSSMFLL